jgi:hypothetical protein
MKDTILWFIWIPAGVILIGSIDQQLCCLLERQESALTGI